MCRKFLKMLLSHSALDSWAVSYAQVEERRFQFAAYLDLHSSQIESLDFAASIRDYDVCVTRYMLHHWDHPLCYVLPSSTELSLLHQIHSNVLNLQKIIDTFYQALVCAWRLDLKSKLAVCLISNFLFCMNYIVTEYPRSNYIIIFNQTREPTQIL